MPQTYQQQYAAPSAPLDIAGMMRKTFLIIILAIGALFLFIGRLLAVFATDSGGHNAAMVMSTLGGFAIAFPAATWALGSKRTTDMQNLGLLILAGLMLVAMVY
jgi:uncharacterized membrane protein YhaH (DUF805 family)